MMFSKSVDKSETKNVDLGFCGPNTYWFPNITSKSTKTHICQDFQCQHVENHYFGHTYGRRCLLDFSGGGFLVHICTIKNINLFVHSSPDIFFLAIFHVGDPPTYYTRAHITVCVKKASRKSCFDHNYRSRCIRDFSCGGFLVTMIPINT